MWIGGDNLDCLVVEAEIAEPWEEESRNINAIKLNDISLIQEILEAATKHKAKAQTSEDAKEVALEIAVALAGTTKHIAKNKNATTFEVWLRGTEKIDEEIKGIILNYIADLKDEFGGKDFLNQQVVGKKYKS